MDILLSGSNPHTKIVVGEGGEREGWMDRLLSHDLGNHQQRLYFRVQGDESREGKVLSEKEDSTSASERPSTFAATPGGG